MTPRSPDLEHPAWLKPETVVYVLFGDYGLPNGETWFSSRVLVGGLVPFGISEPAARMTLTRMKQRGSVQSEQVGKVRGYRLTERGKASVSLGGTVLRATWDKPSQPRRWDEMWTLVTFTIPEEKRAVREKLRWWLTDVHKFGQVTPGTYLHPRPLSSGDLSYLESPERAEHVTVLRGPLVTPRDARVVVRRTWPTLEKLSREYEQFMRRYSPITDPATTARMDKSQLFAWRITCMSEFVVLCLQDPDLPPELAPHGWRGDEAVELFHAVMRLLQKPAAEYFESLR